ncbi:MAG: fused MFS/spermidine synthase [Planctomycetota bacterium]
MSRRSVPAILSLAVASGAAALAYEVVFFRSLGLVFGVASYAVAAVVGAFLLGLGVGARLAGDRLARFRPLRAYAAIEALVALFGVASPHLFRALRAATERGDLGLASPLVVALASFALLAWPTLLMGATFPLLGRAIASRSDGRVAAARLSWLYGANTLGAAAGALAASYVLLPSFGMSGATHAAVLVNVALAVLAGLLSIGEEEPAAPADAVGAEKAGAELDVAPGACTSAPLLASVALVGASSIALQVLANRLVVSLLGGTVYVFGAIVAVFLVGIAAGGAVGGQLVRGARAPFARLSALALLFAASIGLGVALLVRDVDDGDVLVAARNVQLYEQWTPVFTPAQYLARTTGIAALLLLGATLASGAFFTAALAVAGAARSRVGPVVGRVYLWNTLGSIAGATGAAFLLLPRLGLRAGLLVAVALALLAAVLAFAASLARDEPRGAGRARAFAPVSVALVLAAVSLLAFVPGEPPGADEGLELVFHRQSAPSAATVVEFEDVVESEPVRSLSVNGLTVASSIMIDRRLQYLLGFVSTLVHEDPREMLCIGLGTGMTSAAMAVAGGDLTVVELSPAVVEAAAFFERWNASVTTRDDVTVVVDDGRAWLARSDRLFDVISADPIDPCVSGSAYLYTEEYYRLGREHLAPGGVMSQWIPLYNLSTEDIAGIVRTFRLVFPDATAWATGYDIMLIGSLEPLELEPAHIEARLAANDEAREMLADVAIESVDELLACCFAGPSTLAEFERHASRPNTDDDPWIEFSAPLSAHGTYPLEVFRELAASTGRPPLADDVGGLARRSIDWHAERLRAAMGGFVTDIEVTGSYGLARTNYIDALRADD